MLNYDFIWQQKKNNATIPRIDENGATIPRIDENGATIPKIGENGTTIPKIGKIGWQVINEWKNRYEFKNLIV